MLTEGRRLTLMKINAEEVAKYLYHSKKSYINLYLLDKHPIMQKLSYKQYTNTIANNNT